MKKTLVYASIAVLLGTLIMILPAVRPSPQQKDRTPDFVLTSEGFTEDLQEQGGLGTPTFPDSLFSAASIVALGFLAAVTGLLYVRKITVN
jgi:hypothetical protein